MFQNVSEASYLTFVVVSTIVITLVVFAIGVIITRWMAKKKEWDEAWKPALILNIFWAVVQFILYGIAAFIPYGVYYGIVFSLLINILVGAFVATRLYEKEYREALIFVLIVQIILFIISFIISYLLGTLLMILILGEVINPYTQ